MLTEFGVTVARGLQNVDKLRDKAAEAELPRSTVVALKPLFAMLDPLNDPIQVLTEVIEAHVKADKDAQRLMEVPGIGASTDFAILAFAGDLLGFKNGREFAAWLGLTPKEHSTDGRHRTGSITKMGQRDVHSLRVNGAMAVLQQTGRRPKELMSPWLRRMCNSKPRTVVAVALANRIARVAWALMVKQSHFDRTKCPIG